VVSPLGVPSHCNFNELFCPACANAPTERKRIFSELSSRSVWSCNHLLTVPLATFLHAQS